MEQRSEQGIGVASAVAAYTAWGLFPAWWKQLAHVSSTAIIAHRVLWSFVVVIGLIALSRRWSEVGRALRNRRALAVLGITTALISSNWLLFIWAVNSGRVTEASLGYYINPLVNVLLARLVLGERLRPLQIAAVVLATAGVIWLALGVGAMPWVSLSLATTFGLYGLLRKRAPVEPLTGLAVETGIAAPVALAWLAFAEAGSPLLGGTGRDAFFLLGSGVATALPLLWFAMGARRLRYSTMGIIQYLAPTGQLALAVLAYGEPFTPRHALTFALIWSAIVLYAVDGFLARSPRMAPGAPALRS